MPILLLLLMSLLAFVMLAIISFIPIAHWLTMGVAILGLMVWTVAAFLPYEI